MPLMKRATAELARHGLSEIEVRKGLWGYYAVDTTYRKQSWPTCRSTAKEIIADVLAGVRPQKLG